MARNSEPWEWKARKAWYAWVDGKQIKLGKTKKEATLELYRIKASSGRLDERQYARMTVLDACEACCAQAQGMRPSTRRHYADKLGAFASKFGSRRLSTVTPEEVVAWVKAYDPKNTRPFGDPSRYLLFSYVKILFKWARDTGILEVNPFARVQNPWIVLARTSPMSDADYEAVMLRPGVSAEFKECLEFIWRTGIRPDELAKLTAKHLDSRHMIARLQASEHKTGRRTNLPREIHFPPDLWERLKGYAQKYPSGPLIRRRNGRPWSANNIGVYFGRLKKRMGLTCVLYQARHRYITTLLERGVPLAMVAKMAGHTHVDTIMKNYFHPDTALMQEHVVVASAGESARMDAIAARREEAKSAANARARQKSREASNRHNAKKRAKKIADADT